MSNVQFTTYEIRNVITDYSLFKVQLRSIFFFLLTKYEERREGGGETFLKFCVLEKVNGKAIEISEVEEFRYLIIIIYCNK